MNHSFEIHYIEKPELEEVQEYDYYYEEFLDSEFRGSFKDKSKVAASNLKPLLVFYLKDRHVKDLVLTGQSCKTRQRGLNKRKRTIKNILNLSWIYL